MTRRKSQPTRSLKEVNYKDPAARIWFFGQEPPSRIVQHQHLPNQPYVVNHNSIPNNNSGVISINPTTFLPSAILPFPVSSTINIPIPPQNVSSSMSMLDTQQYHHQQQQQMLHHQNQQIQLQQHQFAEQLVK